MSILRETKLDAVVSSLGPIRRIGPIPLTADCIQV